jgi:hypothetical protein
MDHSRVALCCAFALLLNACTLTPKRDALNAAEQYSLALDTGQFDAAVALTDPEIIKRVPKEQLRTLLGEIFDPANRSVIGVRDEVLGISNEFSDSVGLHYFVPNKRLTRMADGDEIEFNSYYIVTSRDLGRTWKIVDLGCVDEQWIRGVAPGWNGYPQPPEQSIGKRSSGASR